jgi:hypothetical protein
MTDESFGVPGVSFTAAAEGINTAKIRSINKNATPSPIPFFKIPFLILSQKPQPVIEYQTII